MHELIKKMVEMGLIKAIDLKNAGEVDRESLLVAIADEDGTTALSEMPHGVSLDMITNHSITVYQIVKD